MRIRTLISRRALAAAAIILAGASASAVPVWAQQQSSQPSAGWGQTPTRAAPSASGQPLPSRSQQYRPQATAPTTAPQADAVLAPPALLKPEVKVARDVVRLGDIFDGITPDVAGIAVARSPEPGERLVLEANYLAALSQRYKLNWRPESRFERVVLTRASTEMGTDDVMTALRAAAARDGISASAEISLDQQVKALHLPPEASATPQVERFSLDRTTGRFSANLLAGGQTRIALSGKIVEVLQIPVLAERMGPEQTIRMQDLKLMPVRTDRLQADVVTDATQLVGMMPKRALNAGMALRTSDLRAAIMVRKNAVVAIVYRTPTMTLTAQGRAVEEGARGDTIRVQNTATNKMILAEIVGPDQVRVVATHRVAMPKTSQVNN